MVVEAAADRTHEQEERERASVRERSGTERPATSSRLGGARASRKQEAGSVRWEGQGLAFPQKHTSGSQRYCRLLSPFCQKKRIRDIRCTLSAAVTPDSKLALVLLSHGSLVLERHRAFTVPQTRGIPRSPPPPPTPLSGIGHPLL